MARPSSAPRPSSSSVRSTSASSQRNTAAEPRNNRSASAIASTTEERDETAATISAPLNASDLRKSPQSSPEQQQQDLNTMAAAASDQPKIRNLLLSTQPGAQFENAPIPPLAMSKAETILLSSAGDVVVCRDRNGPYPPEPDVAGRSNMWNNNEGNWQKDLMVACCDAECDDAMSASLQESALCSPWNGDPASACSLRPGLMGGAPVVMATSPIHHGAGSGGGDHQFFGQASSGGTHYYSANSPRRSSRSSSPRKLKFRSSPMEGVAADEFDAASIVPIRSFDYSHFDENDGNDMLPPYSPKRAAANELEARRAASLRDSNGTNLRSPRARKANKPSMSALPWLDSIHFSVPNMLPAFSQVRVTQVSAHPMGSHVLLISDAGLLYSYGLNDFGQLGIGVQYSVLGPNQGHAMSPTIVTPLVENGGKAIACSAGVNHSLVVVQTEEQRLVKTRSFEQNRRSSPRRRSSELSATSSSGSESVVYHQVYGFGRNDYMKIGLVSPKLSKKKSVGPVDEMECVVLPRRVGLRCKVRPVDNDQQQPQGIFAIEASLEHSAALVRRSSGDVELYAWGHASYGALGLGRGLSAMSLDATTSSQPGRGNSAGIQTVPVPSFVASLSRTSNPDARSASLLLEEEREYPTSIALGPQCSFVTTSLGRCFSFGVSDEGLLGHGKDVTEAPEPMEIALPEDLRKERIVSVSVGARHVVACTKSGVAMAWGNRLPSGLYRHAPGSTVVGSADAITNEPVDIAWSPERVDMRHTPADSGNSKPRPRIAYVGAGYDSSIFVCESGKVLSCGRGSGRLGLGEMTQDVHSPTPLFGGLRLWQERMPTTTTVSPTSHRPALPDRSTLRRGATMG